MFYYNTSIYGHSSGLTVLPDMLLLRITYTEKTMKKLIIILTLLFTASAQADSHIVLKDWQLGLDKKQIKQVKKDNKICGKGKFSLKATKGKGCGITRPLLTGLMTMANEFVYMPKITYTDGKVSAIFWMFEHDGGSEIMPSFRWDHFVGAFKNKYGSALKCEEHTTETRIGASYNDVKCFMQVGDQILQIDKYGDSISYGTVLIAYASEVEEKYNNNQETANQDL